MLLRVQIKIRKKAYKRNGNRKNNSGLANPLSLSVIPPKLWRRLRFSKKIIEMGKVSRFKLYGGVYRKGLGLGFN